MTVLILIIVIVFLAVLVFYIELKYYKLYLFSRLVFGIQTEWLNNRIYDRKISRFLEVNHFRKIGIIGFNQLSLQLWRELKQDNIEVIFCASENEYCISPYPDVLFILISDIEKHVDKVDALIDVRIDYMKNYYDKYDKEYVYSKPTLSLSNVIFYTNKL